MGGRESPLIVILFGVQEPSSQRIKHSRGRWALPRGFLLRRKDLPQSIRQLVFVFIERVVAGPIYALDLFALLPLHRWFSGSRPGVVHFDHMTKSLRALVPVPCENLLELNQLVLGQGLAF